MLVWAHGSVSKSIQKKVQDNVVVFEDNIPYMYLDSLSTVTVGAGTALFSEDDAHCVSFYNENTRAVAGKSDVSAAWNAVQACSVPRGKPCNFSAGYFKRVTDLRISLQETIRLINGKLEGFYRDLVRIYPGFDSMPEPAKVALFDMIYNLGPQHLEYKFVHFTASVRARKWNLAAQQCDRPQVQAIRNHVIKQYFLDAAKLAGDSTVADGKVRTSPVLALKHATNFRPLAHARVAQGLPLPPPPEPFPMRPYQAPIPAVLRVVTQKVIVSGDRGENVRVVQNAVNRVMVARRPPLALDGDFGKMTLTAVRGAQAAAGLVADGVVGAETRRALGLVLA